MIARCAIKGCDGDPLGLDGLCLHHSYNRNRQQMKEDFFEAASQATLGYLKEGNMFQMPSPEIYILPEGRKDDSGKCRLDLLPLDALWEVGRVYTFGASHYGGWNWAKGIKYSRVIAALLRHLFKWVMGEKIDEESQCHHLSSVVWCGLALLHYDLNKERFEEFDDRRQGLWAEVWKH